MGAGTMLNGPADGVAAGFAVIDEVRLDCDKMLVLGADTVGE